MGHNHFCEVILAFSMDLQNPLYLLHGKLLRLQYWPILHTLSWKLYPQWGQ